MSIATLYERLVSTVEAWPDDPVFAVPRRLLDDWAVPGGGPGLLPDGTWTYAAFLDRVRDAIGIRSLG